MSWSDVTKRHTPPHRHASLSHTSCADRPAYRTQADIVIPGMFTFISRIHCALGLTKQGTDLPCITLLDM